MAVLALALTACPAETPRSAEPTAPPRGIARIAVPEEPATLDPLTTAGMAAATRHLLPLVTPLIGGSGPGSVRAEFIVAGTGVTRVRVPPGSTWSSGAPISGADIARTWRLVRAAKVPFEGYERVTDIQVNAGGDAVVTYGKEAIFLASGIRVLPPGFNAGAYARAWPISGGPFTFTRWTPGLRIAFVANPNAPGRTPRLAGLDVTFVPDPDAALALFRRGEIDILTRFGAPAWHERMVKAGARVSQPGEGRTVALVLRAPATATARRRLLARMDLARITDVLVQDEAAVACARFPTLGPCDQNPTLPAAGPKVGALTLAFEGSDVLAGRIALALRKMLGAVRLQPRDAADLWTHLPEIDLALITSEGRDDLATLDAAGKGSAPRVFVLFVARASLGAREELPAPGPDGPFDGAGDWPSSLSKA